MGMDVFGKEPTTEEGEYFRNTVTFWRPLADYVQEVAPEVTLNCTDWQTNDGDGLDADDAKKLADILQKEIDAGRTKSYAEDFKSPPEWPYAFSVGNVQDFVAFLRGCGGFEIC